MNTLKRKDMAPNTSGREDERGSAIVLTLFVLALVSVFVAIALSRTSSEAAATGNETAEGRTFYAAQGSLEMMSRNFNKKFEITLKPSSTDFNDVRTAEVPGLSTTSGGVFTFNQEVLRITNDDPVVLPTGPFAGLYAKRDNWRLRTTATDNTGIQVQLTRNVLNNLVPIFQFGIFYDDNLEFHPGPRFDFGGRVHSNGSLFLQAGSGLYFSSKVTAANHVYTDTSKNGSPWTNWNDEVFIKNASNTYVQLQNNMGSVQAAVSGAPVVSNPPQSIPNPTAYNNPNWPTNRALFDGNLIANSPLLQLPLKLNSDNNVLGLDLIEVVKRGKDIGDLRNDGTGTVPLPSITAVTAANDDDAITAAERYYNKTGIRVSLADSRKKLPGCAAALDTDLIKCGVRLDGDSVGQTSGVIAGPRGYQPRAMAGAPAYQATKINGERFNSGTTSVVNPKETWIKVETVIYNPTTEVYDKQEITQDILSLGVTEQAPNDANFSITEPGYNTIDPDCTIDSVDCRSIIKLQRFVIPGATIPGVVLGNYISNSGGNNYVLPKTVALANTCAAVTATSTPDNGTIALAPTPTYFPNGFAGDNAASMRAATVSGVAGKSCVVPFPINVFDTREGLYNDTTAVFNPLAALTAVPAGYGLNVPWAGVMSMVDIDVANLKKFLDGTWDTKMPIGTPYHTATTHVLRGNDIPQTTNTAPKSGGWVFYVSDRRGDYDFDGEYDMEDVYGPNDTNLQIGEDLNKNGTLQTDYTNEAAPYTGANSNISPDIAAVFEHKYYRRGVRLINSQTIPGNYDTVTPTNTKGFTVASENGIYVQGNYNATGVTSYGTPTPYSNYVPAPTSSLDVPASIAADAITILSTSWQDSLSFTAPFNLGSRNAGETTIRFAMLSGDTLTTLSGTPNQGGGDLKMNGGVHNFKRFLENWGGNYLNYSGSIINLFSSHNSSGPFKCCSKVYSPPNRNWVFDSTFLDVNRLPPGTPYFQYIQTTGFQRTND